MGDIAIACRCQSMMLKIRFKARLPEQMRGLYGFHRRALTVFHTRPSAETPD
ncbi:hypothetical protein [Desulfosarcina sp.]|uniref:hypothetical protein n=1 Tax=Desulfosarcina sp. TaxID=2027861 RepID=UPI0035646A0E